MSFKETWQNILTKIDNRIPIKKITSPLDKKYPLTSFFIFLLIVLVILYFIFGTAFLFSKSNVVELTIRLADTENNILDNFEFKIRNISQNVTNNYVTNENGSFRLSLDKKNLYLFIVETSGYEYFEEELSFESPTNNFVITLLNLPSSFPKIVYFQDALTDQKILDPLNVSVVCDNGDVITPSSASTSDGSMILEVPVNCNAMYANVSSDKYNATSIPIKITDSIIKLNPQVSSLDVGSVYVSVMSGELFIEESITLKIFSKDDPVNPIKTTQTNNSMANLTSIPVGEYIVRANDLQNRYLSSQQEINVIKNQMTEITINMIDTGDGTLPIIDPDTNQEIEIRQVTVFVKDKDTGEVLDDIFNPKVSLLLDGNQNVEEREAHDGFVFVIDKNKSYSLKAVADEYIPGEIIDITSDQSTYIFNLEKITINNVSKVYVKVEDEDKKPIVGIKSWIYDREGQYIDPRFQPSISDENGVVVFNNIPDLNFTVKVKNNYIEETSIMHHNSPPEDTNISLPVTIGKGTIILNIKNKLNESIPDSTVTFYSETGEILGTTVAPSTGVLQNQVKADKRVFVKIETNGYLPYFTQMHRIYKNQTITKDIVLERALDGLEMVTEYLGLYNASNQKVESLKNNEVFYLKFKTIMPNNTSNFNFTLRAGSLPDVKDDIVFIMPENNSLGVSVYYEKENFSVSSNFLESKLVNFKFNDYPSSVHEITVPVRIKNAKTNDSVSFFYASSKTPINYMTHNYTQVQYFVDATSLCNDVFCFSGQYVDVLEGLRFDIKSNNLVSMRINSDYILEYTITNSSQNNYTDARFSARNLNTDNNPTSMVDIRSYDVSGEFSSVGTTAVGENNFNIPFNQLELLTDNLNAFSKINVSAEIFPIILGQSKLSNRIVSDQEVIYSLPINYSVSELEQMSIDYQPKNIVPGVPFILTVIVKDSKGDVLEGVNINILQKVNNDTITISTGRTTNREGKADISLPSLRPEESFIIEAIKSKYYATPVEFIIKKDILDILHETKILNEDSTLDVFIHKTKLDGEEYTLTFKNKTEYPLTLKRFNNSDFSFDKVYLLNLGQTLNHINNQINDGLLIPANQSKEINIKFAPSDSARTHPNSEDILGSITSTLSLNNVDYLFNIPVKVKLSIGTGVLFDDCLVISAGPDEWNTVITGNLQTISLDVRNFCLSKEGKAPVTIKNVQAKLTSQGDRYGTYFLRLIGPGSANQIQLSENYYKTIVNEMKPEDEYRIEVTFNTNGTKFADVKSNIYLNAQIETEEGLVYVNKAPKDLLLKTNISVMDLTDCFSYVDGSGNTINKGGLFVLEGINENTLTIKNNCQGKATFKMNLCEGNDFGCRDLSILNTDEENNILNFSLVDTEKTISIKRKDSTKPAGAYILNNKVSVVNNFGREVTSSFVPLRINAKDLDGLWMDDPFIEISEDKTSPIVRLYNSDKDRTLWNYLSAAHPDFTIDEFNENHNYLRNIKYTEIDDLNKSKHYYKFFYEEGFYAPITLLVEFTIDALTNEYDVFYKNKIFDINSEYLKSVPKQITLEDFSSSHNFDLSLIDMTALKNYSFYKNEINVDGKLIKKMDFTNPAGSCPQNQEYVTTYDYFVKSDGCSLDSKLVDENGLYKYVINCSGAVPRNTIDLHHEAYLVCKDNDIKWPEQAAVKPLQFNLENSLYDSIYDDSKKYYFKNILLTPTLNELNNFNEDIFNQETIGNYRFGFFLTKPEETVNYDLNVYDCITDTGKLGKTGEGAVPNTSLDWSWSLDDLNKCSDTYCDATQLTQVVLNRIHEAEKLISSKSVLCPISPEQIIDQMNDGTYMVSAEPGRLDNEIPVNKSGLKSIVFSTIEDQLKIKVTLENRTDTQEALSLYLKLSEIAPTKIETINSTTGELEEISVSETINLTANENDILSVIYTYGNNNNPIIQDQLQLDVVYNSVNKYQPHSTFTSILDLSKYQSNITGCQVPSITSISNGINFIDLWLNDQVYPNNVTSPWSQDDIKKLKELLDFDVYLITDKYNNNFIKDFDVAYGGIASKEEGLVAGNYSIMASPTIFNQGYLSRLFKNNLYFVKEYSDEANNVNINVAGKYKIKIDFEFNNSSWNFENSGELDVKSYVTFRFISSPENDSVFYRIPFNGFLGHTTAGYNRQGYGVSYIGDIISIDGDKVTSDSDFGSNPLRRINVTRNSNLHKINSGIDTRGNILNINYDDQIIDVILSPSKATPILMNLKKNNTTPLDVYYRLKDKSDNAFIDSTSLLRWTGVGSGCDFSGNSVFNNVYYDRYAGNNGPQSSYVLDWSNIVKTGNIYLRTIFYSPEKEIYTLENRSDQGVDVKFSLNADNYSSSLSLGSSTDSLEVNSIKSIFDLIKDNKVCVVNSTDGKSSEFFYNPSQIYSNEFINEPSNAIECN